MQSKPKIGNYYLSVFIFNEFVENLEDTKGVVRRRKSKKDRQHNGQKKKDQKDKQQSKNSTQKVK